jgi:hypothetical protein
MQTLLGSSRTDIRGTGVPARHSRGMGVPARHSRGMGVPARHLSARRTGSPSRNPGTEARVTGGSTQTPTYTNAFSRFSRSMVDVGVGP